MNLTKPRSNNTFVITARSVGIQGKDAGIISYPSKQKNTWKREQNRNNANST